MRIYFESPQRLKIELDKNDLIDLNITYDELDYDKAKTRRVINELLERIGAENDFDIHSGKMIIEVFPALNGGCIIYFTAVKPASVTGLKRSENDRSVWELCSADDLMSVAERFAVNGSKNPISLHLLNNRYRLTVSDISKREELILSEYADKIGTSAAAVYTNEHGKLLSLNIIGELGVSAYSRHFSAQQQRRSYPPH